LLKGKGGGPKQRQIMELNPTHPILIKLHERFQKDIKDPLLDTYATLLLGYGLLAEGSELPDPVGFNQQLAGLMLKNL